MVSGANFLTGILLARYLGIEEFGRFTLALIAILFVGSVQRATIVAPMMSLGPKQTAAHTPSYYNAVLMQQVLFSCLVFIVLFGGLQLAAGLFPGLTLREFAFPLATAASAFAFQDFLRRYFFTRGSPDIAFVSDAIRYFGQVVLIVWMHSYFRERMDSVHVLWIIVVSSVVASAYAGCFIDRIATSAPTLLGSISQHWNFSKWLLPSSLIEWMTGNIFVLSAGALLGTTAVGALRAGQYLMGVVHVLIMGLENMVPVQAARLFHVQGKKALRDYLKRVTLLGGGATVALSLLIAIAPEFWLHLIFGSEYRGYGFLLQWYAVHYVLIFLLLPLCSGLRAIEQPKTIFTASFWAALFSAVAAYPFTHYFGLLGVVAGALTACSIQVWILWQGLKKSWV